MTTDNKAQDSVSAEEEQDEPSVSAEEEQIAQAVADASSAPETEEQQEEQAPRPLTADDLDKALKDFQSSFQGRQANYTAEQLRQHRESLKQEFDASLAPLREQAALIEQARIEQLEPEEQAEYWRKRALEPSQVTEPVVPAEQTPAYSDTDVSRLRGRVEGMLANAGINIDPEDDRLWVGARVGASIDDLFTVAQQNAKGLAPAPQTPAETPAPSRPRVPSTSGAPKTQGRSYNSRTDIAEALQAGDINSDQAREFTRNLG